MTYRNELGEYIIPYLFIDTIGLVIFGVDFIQFHVLQGNKGNFSYGHQVE